MLVIPFAAIALSFFATFEFWYGFIGGMLVIYTAVFLFTRRTPEPMRSELIEVLEQAARQAASPKPDRILF